MRKKRAKGINAPAPVLPPSARAKITNWRMVLATISEKNMPVLVMNSAG
jgi:hypothetical protein